MWRDSETGTVVQRHDEIRALRPLKTLPADLTDEVIANEGFVQIAQSNPQFNPMTQRVDGEAEPVDIDGTLTQAWNIVDLSPEEQTATVTSARAEVWEKIKAERFNRQNGGVQVNGKWFQTDEASRIQYLSLKMMGDSMPSSIQWKTMDNTFVTMSMALVNQIFVAIVVQDQNIFATAEQHRAAIEASENPSAYNFMDGWPVTFNSPEQSDLVAKQNAETQ